MYTDVGFIHPCVHSELLKHICSFIYTFHMPLFTFISGCVFSYQCEIKKKAFPFKKLVFGKFKRLIIPYLFFGVFNLAPFMYLCGYENDFFQYIYKGIILSENSRHLWFLLMLFWVFILFYVINTIRIKTNLSKPYLIIAAIILHILSYTYFIPPIWELNTAFRYLFWFTLGYLFFLYTNTLNNVCFKFIIPFTLICLFTLREETYSRYFLPLVSISGIFMTIAVSYSYRTIAETKIFKIISKNSMGIYLFHVVIIYTLYHYTRNIPINPFMLSFSIFIISLLVSVFLTQLIRKIKLGFIIGENY